MAILLVVGVMDLRVMAVVAAAITVERLAPAGERVARATGAVVIGAGLFLIARAAGLGSCIRVESPLRRSPRSQRAHSAGCRRRLDDIFVQMTQDALCPAAAVTWFLIQGGHQTASRSTSIYREIFISAQGATPMNSSRARAPMLD